MYKNTEHVAKITALSSEGAGIAKIDGYTVFVPSCVTGDVVKLLIVKENKNFGYGKLLEIVTPSPLRTDPSCKVFGKCGGCSLQVLKYPAQLEFKRKKVEDALRRIGGFTDIEVTEVYGSEPNTYYRNKAQYPAAEVNGCVAAGFYAPHSHRCVVCDDCTLQDKRNNEILNHVTKWATQNNITVYDEKTGKGTLRHICVRCGKDEAVLTLVTAKPIKKSDSLVKSITEKFPYITGIVENYNDKKTNVIYGEKDVVLYGVPYIYDFIGDIKYKVHYRSFYQVNPYTTKLLYEKAVEFASPEKDQNVFDLYCGTGTISLFLAKKAAKVIGIEIVDAAVENAKENAKLNNITNAFFYCGEAEKKAPELIKEGVTSDIVVLDPPRKGCGEELLTAIGEMSPEKIVYVSCDPATMARDAKILCQYGYKISDVSVYDQFPHTSHVESVVLLEQLSLPDGK